MKCVEDRIHQLCNSQGRLYQGTDLKGGPWMLAGGLGGHQMVVWGWVDPTAEKKEGASGQTPFLWEPKSTGDTP